MFENFVFEVAPDPKRKQIDFTKRLSMWLGSYLVIGICLFYYMHIPFLPILFGGLLTLAFTVKRYYRR